MKRRRVALGLGALALLELALRLRSRENDNWLDEGLRPGALVPSLDKGERRVVVLGDSIPYGRDVAEEESYPHLLGRLLAERAPGQRIRVINAGISGNTVLQGLRRLGRHVLPHEPDVVIVAFGLNDQNLHRSAPDIEREWAFRMSQGPLGELWRILCRSHLVRVAGARVRHLALRGLGWLVPTHREEPRVRPQLYGRGLEALIGSIPRESRVLLLTLTAESPAAAEAAPPALQSQQRALYQRNDAILRDLAQRSRATLVDVSCAFDKAHAEEPWLADGVHLSPQGQAAMAQALIEPTLGALGLL